jgi:trimeric autotransporter adhesin
MIYRVVVSCVLVAAIGTLLLSCASSSSLSSIQVNPATASVGTVGGTAQFSAMGTYTRSGHPSTSQNITSTVTWASSSIHVATINSAGLATAVGNGSTSITATMDSSAGPVIGTASLTVTGTGVGGGGANQLTAITITPSSQTLNAIGEVAQFIAIGTYSSAPTSQDITNQVTWVSSAPSVATINSSGLATATGCLTTSCAATIIATATSQGGATITGTGTLNVSPSSPGGGARSLSSIQIIPSTQTLSTIGENSQFIAMGTFSEPPTTENLSGQVAWASNDMDVATINASGLATAVGCGTTSCATTITASTTSQSGSLVLGAAALTVSPGAPPQPRTLSAITILPGTGTQILNTLGETAQFIAMGTFTASPITVDMTDMVTWASSDMDVATINSQGLATAVACNAPAPPCITNLSASATAQDGSFIVGTSNLAVNPGTGGSGLPSLSVYLVGAGTGTVVSSPVGINCTGSGSGCSAFFPQGSAVTLTASPGSSFGGWSANCTPNNASPCTVTMTTNQTVGAIFN